MNAGLNVYRSGQVSKILLILNNQKGKTDLFGIRNFDRTILATLDSLGIPEKDLYLLPLHIKPPYTINTARGVAEFMKSKGFKSAVIINDNFHIRRSYLAYRAVFEYHNLDVYPGTFKIYIDSHNWWKSAPGIQRVFSGLPT